MVPAGMDNERIGYTLEKAELEQLYNRSGK